MEENKQKTFSAQEAAVISESVGQSKKIIDEKIKNVNWLMTAIVVVLFVAFLTMLLMVAQLVIEAFRFNSTIYQEFQKSEVQTEQPKTIFENLQGIKIVLKH